MINIHKNILKLLNDIINNIVLNIDKYSISKHDFTRCRKLNAIDLIRVILGMGAGSLNLELLKAFPDVNLRMTASAFEQQKAKLKPECFKQIMIELNKAKSEHKLLDDRYLVLAIDGSDFNPPFNPNSENLFQRSDGKEYCQTHVNALYDILDKLYIDISIQPKQKMDERRAALEMLKRINGDDQEFLVLMDRGYSSFNLIENCNRLDGCKYLVRTKTGNGGIKELASLEDHAYDIALSCRITDSNYYFKTHKDIENIHLVDSKHSASLSKNAKDHRWDFERLCTVKFRACKLRINPPGSEDEWEILITNLDRESFPLSRLKEIYHLRWGIETSFREIKYDLSAAQFHSKKDQFVYMELYAHFAMYNAISLSMGLSQHTKGKGKHQYKLDFKMACCAFKQRFSSNDNSDESFNNMLVNIAYYLTPIRLGRKDKRNMKAKMVIGFPYRLAA